MDKQDMLKALAEEYVRLARASNDPNFRNGARHLLFSVARKLGNTTLDIEAAIQEAHRSE